LPSSFLLAVIHGECGAFFRSFSTWSPSVGCKRTPLLTPAIQSISLRRSFEPVSIQPGSSLFFFLLWCYTIRFSCFFFMLPFSPRLPLTSRLFAVICRPVHPPFRRFLCLGIRQRVFSRYLSSRQSRRFISRTGWPLTLCELPNHGLVIFSIRCLFPSRCYLLHRQTCLPSLFAVDVSGAAF